MSLNFAFFNGEVTRDRKQEALYRSLNERNNFLQNLNALSEQRMLEDKRNKASKVIQKKWKQFRVRKVKRQEFRQRFDEIVGDQPKNSSLILKLLVNFYEQKLDADRLILGLSEAVRLSRDDAVAARQILTDSRKITLARCCLKFMHSSTPQTNFFMVLRFLETFIVKEQKIFETVINMGYFDALFALLVAVTEPKPESIGQQNPPPRCQQVISRIFSIFEKSASIQSAMVYQKFLKSLTNSVPDLFFINILISQFTANITPTNPHYAKFFEYSLKDGNIKYQLLILEQSQFLENSEELPMYFDCLARINIGKIEIKKQEEDSMDAEDSVDKYLRERIETILESSKFKRHAQAYANLDNFNAFTIVALQRHFLKIIDLLALSETFMKSLWEFIRKSIKVTGFFDENCEEIEFLKSSLILFCGCVKNRISTIADSEFHPDIVIDNFVGVLYMLRDNCLKLITLVHPDVVGVSSMKFEELNERLKVEKKKWIEVTDAVVSLLQVVHAKDERLRFLSEKFWTDHNQSVLISKGDGLVHHGRRIGRNQNMTEEATFVEQLLADYDSDSGDSSDEEGPTKTKVSPATSRNLCVMRNIPFIVPFMERIKLFSTLVRHYERRNGLPGALDFLPRQRGQTITVRRDHLYQDAFDALAPRIGGSTADIRDPIRVKMVNWIGQNEAGMDGGGIYREFLNELLKEGFNMDKALFQVTPNRLLYPNPLSIVVYGADYTRHYQFLGRMLGKLILSKQLIELRFAEFFLSQLFGSQKNDVDLQHMKISDPELFKHLRGLLYLTNEELDDLQLDFSVVTDEFDHVKKINLKHNGANIRVTSENVQEYVRLYVNFHLRLKFAPMVDAMRKGISEVINIEWLSFFSVNEIQTLIAGIEKSFDVDDMKEHCACLNIRDLSDHQYYEMFWEVVRDLSPEDKTALLKFITGCSRPPIEGFKEVRPPLGVMLVDDDDHLPTSATCMNMLKLPKYSSREKLEEKLRYAINAGAGFELA